MTDGEHAGADSPVDDRSSEENAGSTEPSEDDGRGVLEGTFLVTHADEAAVVRDVDTARTLGLADNPGFEEREVVEATIAPEPPLAVAWRVLDVTQRRTIELIDSDLAPTTHSCEAAIRQSIGDIERVERAGRGEIHVLTVPRESLEEVVASVLTDEETIARAARLDADRVEVRRTVRDGVGVVSVRYLPS